MFLKMNFKAVMAGIASNPNKMPVSLLECSYFIFTAETKLPL